MLHCGYPLAGKCNPSVWMGGAGFTDAAELLFGFIIWGKTIGIYLEGEFNLENMTNTQGRVFLNQSLLWLFKFKLRNFSLKE